MVTHNHYHEVFSSISEEVSINICEETRNILAMFTSINIAISKLNIEEKESLTLEKIEFEGFDGNNEHYQYMEFLIDKKKSDRWFEFKGKNLGTKLSLDKYRTMLKYLETLESKNRFNLDKKFYKN